MRYALGFLVAVLLAYGYLFIIQYIKMPTEIAIIFLIFFMWAELNVRISEVKK